MAKKKKAAAKKAKARSAKATKKTAKTSGRKVAAKASAKKATAKKTVKAKTSTKVAKPKAKRKPNPAFMRPLQVSSTLASVIGNGPFPRTEVMKRVWGYIKKNGLQDSVNRRSINADENLRALFGGRASVTMFELTKLVSKHLS